MFGHVEGGNKGRRLTASFPECLQWTGGYTSIISVNPCHCPMDAAVILSAQISSQAECCWQRAQCHAPGGPTHSTWTQVCLCIKPWHLTPFYPTYHKSFLPKQALLGISEEMVKNPDKTEGTRRVWSGFGTWLDTSICTLLFPYFIRETYPSFFKNYDGNKIQLHWLCLSHRILMIRLFLKL